MAKIRNMALNIRPYSEIEDETWEELIEETMDSIDEMSWRWEIRQETTEGNWDTKHLHIALILKEDKAATTSNIGKKFRRIWMAKTGERNTQVRCNTWFKGELWKEAGSQYESWLEYVRKHEDNPHCTKVGGNIEADEDLTEYLSDDIPIDQRKKGKGPTDATFGIYADLWKTHRPDKRPESYKDVRQFLVEMMYDKKEIKVLNRGNTQINATAVHLYHYVIGSTEDFDFEKALVTLRQDSNW